MMWLRELFFFGWRKASKCKKLIKSLQIRLKLLKNKRSIMARLIREDILLLLKLGYYHLAISRAGNLFEDETTVELYDLLDHYCEFLLLNFSYIRKNKDCPNDINEAMSNLVFASTRCGQLPELAQIRELFTRRYSQLNSTNLVNSKVVENILLMKSVPDDVKYRLVDEINKTIINSSEQHQGAMDIIPYSSDSSSIFSIRLSNVSYSSSSCSILSPEMESFVWLNPKTGRIIQTLPEGEMVPYNTYANSSSDLSGDISKATMVYSPSSTLLPEIGSFIVLNPKDGRILNPDSSLESTPSFETIYLDDKRLSKLKSSDMQLIPYQWNNNNNNNKDDHMKEEEELAMYYKGSPRDLPNNSRNHLPKKKKNKRKKAMVDHGTLPCKHVHPKLPDYDQLVAKFTAIKRSNLLLATTS